MLGLLLGMYFFTALGITAGFHRLFVHRSFETYTWVKFIFAVLGSMAVQGSLIKWVGMHRRHHQYSDTTEDPHSPQHETPQPAEAQAAEPAFAMAGGTGIIEID